MNEEKAGFLSQGIVWAETESHQIIRIRTDLLEALPLVGLTEHTTRISYAEHQFGSSTDSFWLPLEAVVTLKHRGRFFRNIHRYSDYKLFTVQTFEKREPIRR